METQTILMVMLIVMIAFAGFQALQLVNLKNSIQESGISGLATGGSAGGDILIEANEIPEQVGGCFR